MVITIDGAAGVGKTSTAKELAKRLGYQYFDTGAMYRAVTLFFIRENVDLSSKSEVVKSLNSIKLNIDFSSESEMQIFLDEDDCAHFVSVKSILTLEKNHNGRFIAP